MQRAIMGDWVAWKPEMAPQAMVTKSKGQRGAPLGFRLVKKSAGRRLGRMLYWGLSSSAASRPKAMNSSRMAKKGYILPMILSMGRIVATK